MTGSDVSLDCLKPENYELAATWLSDPGINRWLYSEWRGRSVSDRMVAMVAANTRNRLFLAYGNDKPIGIIALGEINRIDRSASIWYLLGNQGDGGRGWISRSVALAVGHAFSVLGLHTLYASVMAGNIASRRVLEKNKFCEVGRFRDGFWVNGRFIDRIVFNRILP